MAWRWISTIVLSLTTAVAAPVLILQGRLAPALAVFVIGIVSVALVSSAGVDR